MDTNSGEWLLTNESAIHALAGYDLIEYIPVFDPDTGDYIDDEEVVYGHEQMLVIAGPWDTNDEAVAWGEAHRGDYGL